VLSSGVLVGILFAVCYS